MFWAFWAIGRLNHSHFTGLMTTKNLNSTDFSTSAGTNVPTIILGGTGKTGRRITDRLNAAGVAVRSVSRSSPIPFDWADRTIWDAAVSGARQAYIAYSPDLAMPGAVEEIAEITRRLVERGVRRVVLLSGRGEPEAVEAENIVAASGIEWTILRCSWFNQNFSEGYLLDAVLHGTLALPVSVVSEPFVDADDIADVAAAALTTSSHVGELYELTGPELLSFSQVADIISQSTGRAIEFLPTAAEEFARHAVAQGVPSDLVTLLGYLFREVLDGRNESLADGVQRALKREPRSFTAFAQDAAAAGVWRN